jgi:two-component system LytT family sensor kinase
MVYPPEVAGQQRSSKNKQAPPAMGRATVRAKTDSAKTTFKTNPILALEQVEEAITAAVKFGYQYELGEAYFTLGSFNQNMQEYNSAVLHGNKAKELFKLTESWGMLYNCHYLIGESHTKLTEYDKALVNYENAALLAKKGGENKNYLNSKLEYAKIKMLQAKYDEAEAILIEIQAEAQKENRIDLLAEVDFKLGELYEIRGDFDQAVNLYEVAQTNAYSSNNTDIINSTNVGIIRSNPIANSNHLNTMNSLTKAQDFFTEKNDTVSLLENSIQRADWLFANGNLADAATEYNYNFTLSEGIGDLDAQLNTQKKLYDVLVQNQDEQGSAIALDNYRRLLDSSVTVKNQKQITLDNNQLAMKTVERQLDNLERERSLDQQTILLLEREKDLNSTSIQQQRILLYVFGVILLIFVAVSILVYRNNKAKKRAHQLLYLKSLRAQMNPHFIFNSLNSVNNYISTNNERAANKYLSKFSKLMRQVLEHSQVEFISLKDEIEVLKLYVELEHERFKDKFDFRFSVDEAINTDGFTIPPMLVQPFIENAIWHGLRYKESAGVLEVKFTDKEDYVEILIADNGIGRVKSEELKTINQKKHKSSGMRNVENRREMIQAVFKAKIDYEIVDLPDNTGTQVNIKLYRNE